VEFAVITTFTDSASRPREGDAADSDRNLLCQEIDLGNRLPGNRFRVSDTARAELLISSGCKIDSRSIAPVSDCTVAKN